MEKIKMILDCDVGHDDAVALMVAARHPALELLGVTAVAGNQTLDKTLPNALNVVPGYAQLGVDLRGSRTDSLDRMEQDTLAAARDICARRNVALTASKLSELDPVSMDEGIRRGLMAAAERLGVSCRNMPSGASHDAMAFAPLFPTGMVFIPCEKGVSHNPLENTTLQSVLDGTDVLWAYLAGK